MILSALAALSLLRSLENVNTIEDFIPFAGPVGKEVEAVKELQSRVGSIMWSEAAKKPPTFLRWLRFYKMDIAGAERGLRECIEWRNKYGINKIRDSDPDTKMWTRFYFKIVGQAKNGDPVMIIPFGDWDMRKYIDEVNDRPKFEIIQGQMWDRGQYAVEKVETSLKKARKDPVRYIIICDLINLQYRQLASVSALQLIISMAYNFENNFPEVVNLAVMYNSDWVFAQLLNILRPFLRRSIDKLKPYPKERAKWEKAIRRLVDPKILPYRYGGYSKAERQKLGLPEIPDDPTPKDAFSRKNFLV